MQGFLPKNKIASTRVPVIAQCEQCGLYRGCITPKMPVSGKGRRRILIVGEAPGAKEDEEGVPFVGNSGRELRRIMQRGGIDLERDCWRTNSVICHPPKNRTPTDKELEYCRANILRTIKELQPTVILTLGIPALKTVIDDQWSKDFGSMSRWAGHHIPSVKYNAWICPAFHPAFLLYENKQHLTDLWEKQVHTALSLCDEVPFPNGAPNYEELVQLIYDPQEAAGIIRSRLKAPVAAFDYEANMLKPEGLGSAIYSCSIAWDDLTIAFPWTRHTAEAMYDFVRSKTRKIASNMKFEDRWTRYHLKTPVRNWYRDTMLNAHVLDNRDGVTGLKFQALIRLGVAEYNKHIAPFLESKSSMSKNKIHKIDTRDLLLYNGLDSLLELHVAKEQEKLLIGKIGAAARLLHEGSLALSTVEATGITIDTEYLEKKIKSTEKQIETYTERLQRSKVYKIWEAEYGNETNLNSTRQLGHVLFTKLGYTPAATTATGKPKTDVSSLEGVDSPFVKNYLTIKKKKKALSTNLKGILREVDPKGLLHAVFNLHLADTYRSSSDSPNFQNIPVRNPAISKLVRSAFVARPGRRLVEVDYSGIEVRVAACYHKDPNMLAYIKDPTKDMHRDMASECFMVPNDQVSKLVRYCGKNMFVFPQFYGSMYTDCAKALWEACEQLKLAVDEVPMRKWLKSKGISRLGDTDPKAITKNGTFVAHIKKVEENFWGKRFPVYAKWKQTWWEQYLDKLEFTTLTNFKCSGFMRRNQVINFPVQGSAFHCLLWSLIELRKTLRSLKMKSKIVGQIHDSIVADVPEEEFEEYIALAHEVMTQRITLAWSWIIVPLEIEVEATPVGGTWYDKTPIDLSEILKVT